MVVYLHEKSLHFRDTYLKIYKWNDTMFWKWLHNNPVDQRVEFRENQIGHMLLIVEMVVQCTISTIFLLSELFYK